MIGEAKERRRGPDARDLILAAIIAAAAVAIYVVGSRFPRGVEAAILSVGNADCAVVRVRGARSIVIGGGGQSHSVFGAPARVLLPYLMEVGIRHVHAAVLLGEEEADVGALPALVREMGVDRVVALQDLQPTPSVSLLGSYVLAAGAEWIPASDGTVLHLGGGVRAEILEWRGRSTQTQDLRASALRVEKGPDALVLFHHLPPQLIDAVVEDPRVAAQALLLPDQGSRVATCRRLVTASGAKAVILSVDGTRSASAAPAGLMQWLRDQGIRVLRTDLDGAVILQSNGGGWGIRTFIHP